MQWGLKQCVERTQPSCWHQAGQQQKWVSFFASLGFLRWASWCPCFLEGPKGEDDSMMLCCLPFPWSLDRTMIKAANMAPGLQKGCRWSEQHGGSVGSEARHLGFESCLRHFLCSFELAASILSQSLIYKKESIVRVPSSEKVHAEWMT